MIDLIHRIKRKWMRLRLQPIRVFCFHQVSDVFEPDTMWECDWTQIDQFKRNIMHLKEQYTFISLPEAYHKLTHDKIRYKKYAVLTADDGWASLNNILPWLNEQQIPITLFLNPAYLLGEETRENDMTGLLTLEALKNLLAKYSNISIASHGWNHTLATEFNDMVFQEKVLGCINFLRQSDRYIPFYAYPCGRHYHQHDDYLNLEGIVPVYMDNMKNYCYDGGIHRELLDGLCLC